MGLDIIEFVMQVEETFDIGISDAQAQRLTTPRRVIDCVYEHVPHSSDGFCMSQRAFHKVRRVLTSTAKVPRSWIHPRRKLLESLPPEGRDEIWSSIGSDLGATDHWWPRLPERRWFPGWFPPHMGALAKLIVLHTPMSLFDTEPAWTRSQVAEVVHAVLEDNLGISCSSSEYHDDLSFTEDMGIE